MKVINATFLEKRSGIYSVFIVPGNRVWIIFKRFSEPKNVLHIVRTWDRCLIANFLNATAEVDDLTPLDIAVIPLSLGIHLPDEIKINLLKASGLIEKIAEGMGIEWFSTF